MSRPALKARVYVVERGPEGEFGEARWFGPGDHLPDWAIAAIDNPKVWDGDPPAGAGSAIPKKAAAARWRPADSGAPAGPASTGTPAAGSASDPGDPDPAKDQEPAAAEKAPPRSGPGSSRDAWVAYANARGVEVPDQLRTREDIIAALELAGVPTE